MKFLVTKELGKLARWLRILGFDTVYFKDVNVGRLIIEALRDNRIIITRSKNNIEKLPKNTVLLLSEEVFEQLKELLKKLSLSVDEEKMFSRCTICNETLKEIEKEKIESLVPPYVFKHHDFFMICNNCKRIYWQGSHWGNVKKILEKII